MDLKRLTELAVFALVVVPALALIRFGIVHDARSTVVTSHQLPIRPRRTNLYMTQHKVAYCLIKKIWRTSVLFLGPLIVLFWTLVTSAQGFKARVDSLACMLRHLYAMESSDSSLVWHLLTSWWLTEWLNFTYRNATELHMIAQWVVKSVTE